MSSLLSILNTGGSGQALPARQAQAQEPSGVAFETFLLTAQDRVEYPPAAASGTSTPPEAQEKTAAAGQSDFQGDPSFESGEPGLRVLPSNGLLDLSLHPLAPSEGPVGDDLTVWGDDPAQGRLPASGAVLAQKERGGESEAQDKTYVSGPLAVLLSPSGPDEGSEKEGVRDREADLSGDGGSGASFALETPRTTPVFEEEENEPATESSFVAPSFILSQVEAPAQRRAVQTETVERGKEAEAQAAETGPPDAPSEGLLSPTRALLHRIVNSFPEEGAEEAGNIPAEANRPGRTGDAGGDVRSPASNARGPAGDGPEDLSGNRPGRVLVRDAQEATQPGLKADEKPTGGSFETPPASDPPQRKGIKTEALSVGTPAGDVSQNTPLSLLMQPPPPAPISGERTGDSPPEMAGVQRPETRNPPPPPLAPTPERSAFAPAPGKEGALEADPAGAVRFVEPAAIRAAVAGAIGDRPEVAGAIGDRPKEGTRAGSPEAVVEAIGDRPAMMRGDENLTAVPAEGTPDGKAERSFDSRPANAPVTARKTPVVGAIGDRPQEGHRWEAGQALGLASDNPSEMGMVRPSDAGTDDRPPATAVPLETQGRAAERAAPFNREVEPSGGQTPSTGVERPETQGRAAERTTPFNREVEPSGGQAPTTGVERPERWEGDPSEGPSDPAPSQAERAAPGERHEGKSDRRDAKEGERPTADQAVSFSSHLGDPVSLKTPSEYGSDPTASAQRQSAASAAGPSPAGARVYTPAAASAGGPDHPPEAVVRQVIRGARFLLKDDVSEVRVRLEPPELGSVHIRLVSGGDTLSGEIGVSNQDVKGIVESHLHQLRSSLTEQGLHVGHIDVSVRDDQRGGAWPDRTDGFGRQDNPPDDRRSPGRNGSPAWEAPEENQRPRRSQSLVDYFA
ncbi:MAG: hypothetical protein A3F84_10510 [Candidatus Handelsmanbacteria bacterium RIFCSPLOWO2_12_FULL_64_10]|uniref:Flagellar hook-length control protein-like C-terminal domain-containing protein n=1 Tax=Handelsmanbacteria sp. (strain RIFCSPLOWO2_12_FULL_64_10) TaxID=1817868 RepID=A0A1F6D657_HANXR|nr:MAG: hypothetical protein A3F84_10510 [Candidatus Handelsmanbacteria bacterium RIFCSPLOWO2_12_FULL_64_10]